MDYILLLVAPGNANSSPSLSLYFLAWWSGGGGGKLMAPLIISCFCSFLDFSVFPNLCVCMEHVE